MRVLTVSLLNEGGIAGLASITEYLGMDSWDVTATVEPYPTWSRPAIVTRGGQGSR